MTEEQIAKKAQKFERDHCGTTLRFAWACGYHAAVKDLKGDNTSHNKAKESTYSY